MRKGLTEEQVEKCRGEYGLNEHPVDIPNLFEFMFDKMTGAFFVLQYIFVVENFLTNFYALGGSLLAFLVITTIINYILIYRSYREIQLMAEK